MWKRYSEHPRRVNPPTELVSREVKKDAFRIIISIVKNSDMCQVIMNSHVNKNNNAVKT